MIESDINVFDDEAIYNPPPALVVDPAPQLVPGFPAMFRPTKDEVICSDPKSPT
jgi:hypothetical protein